MTDKNEILWNIYQEHCNWERHHEDQRSSLTNIMIAVAAGVLGVISIDQTLSKADVPLAAFLVIQGIFGALFVEKQYERHARHRHLAGRFREKLSEDNPEVQLILVRESAEREHEREYRLLSKLHLHHLWTLLHISFAVLGVLLMYKITQGKI